MLADQWHWTVPSRWLGFLTQERIFLIRVCLSWSGTYIHVTKAVQAQPWHVSFSTTNGFYSITAVNTAITIPKAVEQHEKTMDAALKWNQNTLILSCQVWHLHVKSSHFVTMSPVSGEELYIPPTKSLKPVESYVRSPFSDRTELHCICMNISTA